MTHEKTEVQTRERTRGVFSRWKVGKRRSRPREQLIQKFIGMHRHGVFEEQMDDFF